MVDAKLTVANCTLGQMPSRAARRMVDEQLRRRGVTDERVLQAMLEVPREDFVPERLKAHAYDDRALPIGFDQTISQPLVVAEMTQALRLTGSEHVLEVGAGSGYQAAVLGRLAAHVTTVELQPELAERAAATLRRLGFDNVEVAIGDGSRGWPPAAPFDAILVACATPVVPPALLEQLVPGGRMVIPVGDVGGDQVVRLLGADGSERDLFPVRFVPMR